MLKLLYMRGLLGLCLIHSIGKVNFMIVDDIKGILKDYLSKSVHRIESSDLANRLRTKGYYYADTYPICDIGVECLSRSSSALVGYYIESNRPLVHLIFGFHENLIKSLNSRYGRRFSFMVSEYNRNYIHGLIENGAKESNALAVVYYEDAFKELKEILGD